MEQVCQGHPHTIKGIFKAVRAAGSETPSLGNSPRRQLGEGAQCVQLGGRESKDKRKPGGTQRERGGYQEGVTKRRGEKQIRKEQTNILREKSLKEAGRGEM